MMGSYVGAVAGKYVSGQVQLTAFSGLMLLASLLMMRSPVRTDGAAGASKPVRTTPKPPVAAFADGVVIGVEGFLIGVATGFMGVGGGFLIVPALVLLIGLPIHLAIGTSLATIALNSAIGFYKSSQVLPVLHLHVNVVVIASFVAIGITGSLIGGAICHRLPQQKLRRLFAWFVLAMGVYLLWRNLSS
jgi:uncharacterized protein